MARQRKLQRGIYLLPTLLTTGNLVCGFTAVVMSFRGEIGRAAIFIIIAGVLDLLDGRIARMTGTTTEFGSEFDSLADIVSFGVAPAMLAYSWVLEPFGRVGWLVAFLFVICAAMRLARYNIQAHSGERRHFVGLSSPVAAGSLATAAFAFPTAPGVGSPTALPLMLLTATLALLMVSRFRYRSFKDLALLDRRSYIYVLPLAVTMVGVLIWPRWVMPALAGAYLLSAPLVSVSRVFSGAPARKELPHESFDG
ncbi:MAG: CDP-diacylglycerol--serine O-phosphatidyltransferase [Acidobacteria bacterium]|nr:CDP-diacylglycerol--serine O-phosphatidyltransferase [Acidobacteriota bacterium]NIM64242.1 CDP-diacylglycerol--serine O-phosphatidyltransferase [Acidobacteriota bacterium]NIO59240.1 CDP-diacylglycerol--serine O-phosphatidyltransferase [Acidobacteriota bacterium]NIQ30267.1 CDP-diacylglycerol--serine O-phosphatidyltransferase [Acidobacteriota bacterium]NIQ85195.1 CDP-diacylglycerol--serine O-phosphatidyltransferase [Acidobacteriota bacterium]